jgi:hypothetical protein
MDFFGKVVWFVLILVTLLIAIERHRVKHCLTMLKRHAAKNPVTWVFCAPVIVVLAVFVLFLILSSVSGFEVTIRGVYGDSFGVINSLFAGLGFAGLTTTLLIQQMQIGKQEQEKQTAKNELATERYEATLHQLLDLYKKSVDAVVIKSDGTKLEGLDGVGLANNKVLKTIQKHKAAIIPPDLARRLGRNETTEQDKMVLEHLFQRNMELIKATFSRQGRVIKSFTLLMHHLEDRTPACFSPNDMTYPRMMIYSQLTHLEVTYFFYLGLAFRDEQNLRRLLRTSGLLEAFPTVCQYEIHRYMYMHLWNYDPKTGISPQKPTSKSKIEPSDWEVVDDESDDFDVYHRV